jgi:Glyoxalase-like domain
VTGDLDHIVFVWADLAQGCRWFEERTGIAPGFGGVHASGQTQNALVRVGERCYLEILAPVGPESLDDDEWTRHARNAPHGRVLTYCMRSAKPLAELGRIAERRGWGNAHVQSNGRTRPDGVQLRWRWLAPDAVPFHFAFPFFIDWLDSPHPADSFDRRDDARDISLSQLSVGHPRAEELALALADFGCHVDTHPAMTCSMRVELHTPRGNVLL